MNEILFRGKALDSGEWVYGYYFRCKDFRGRERHAIRPEDLRAGEYLYSSDTGGIEVDPETVGQFVGLYADQSVRVFEGDIFAAIPRKIGHAPTIYLIATDIRTCSGIATYISNYKHIGNIHDNRDLYKALKSGNYEAVYGFVESERNGEVEQR